MARRDLPEALSKYMVGTTAHWQARGVSPRQFRTLVKNGELIQWRRGSYVTKRAAEWANDDRRREHVLHVYVAMDSIHAASVPSHQSAAIMHGVKLLNNLGETVTLTLPPGRKRSGRERPDAILHAASLFSDHLVVAEKVRVTSVPRTVADLARALPFMDAVVAADSALHLELASKSEIQVVLEKCEGWPGVRQAKRVIDFADANAGSPLESCGRVFLHEHGFDPPQVQLNIRGDRYSYYADLGWEKHRTLVEFDGKVKYKDENPESLHDQFERDRVLRDAGYKVVHVTWKELFKTPDVVIGRIRKAFASDTAF